MQMRSLILTALAGTVVAGTMFVVTAQNAPPQGAPAAEQGRGGGAAQGRGARGGADPYAGNAAPGTQTFPLAAPAGKDSNARAVAPAGAVNQGSFDPATWKYGTAFEAPAGAKI